MAPSAKMNLDDKVVDGEMDLSMCNLQDVPIKEIAAFKKVYSLDLSSNNLLQLSRLFPTLTHLTKLDLSRNKIKKLPDNFGDLYRLKHLDLYKNQLQHLPLSFGQLKNLKWLDLKENPLVPAIKEAAGDCKTNQACQVCATNMIYFFVKLKEKVDEERTLLEKRQNVVKDKEEKVKSKEEKPAVKTNSQVSLKKSKQSVNSEKITETDSSVSKTSIIETVDEKSSEISKTVVYVKKRSWKLYYLGFFIVTLLLLLLVKLRYDDVLTEYVENTVKGLFDKYFQHQTKNEDFDDYFPNKLKEWFKIFV